MSVIRDDFPVVVIGAGPVGLAAAAHLEQRGIAFQLLEASQDVAASFASVAHVRLFSAWKLNVDAAAVRLLVASGWQSPDPEELPRAGELRERYLRPLAALFNGRVRYGARVVAISRLAYDKVKSTGREDAPFVMRVETAAGTIDLLARAVIDATGTWSQPNPLGASGLPAAGEETFARHIAYGIPDVLGSDRARYLGKRVVVVGAGHSAAGSLLSLAELAQQDARTSIVWVVRGTNMKRVFGGGARDGLPARGSIGTALRALTDQGRIELRHPFYIQAIEQRGERLGLLGRGPSGEALDIDEIDEIIAATGSRPDLSLTRELRVKLDPWIESTEQLAPLIDPNVHSCGSVPPHGHRELAHPEQGYYAVGAKSYGRAPNFLLATGYEQVRSVVAALAGDLQAADDVRLVLPETGVCSTDTADSSKDEGGECCSVPSAGVEPEAATACGTSCGAPARKAKSGCCG